MGGAWLTRVCVKKLGTPCTGIRLAKGWQTARVSWCWTVDSSPPLPAPPSLASVDPDAFDAPIIRPLSGRSRRCLCHAYFLEFRLRRSKASLRHQRIVSCREVLDHRQRSLSGRSHPWRNLSQKSSSFDLRSQVGRRVHFNEGLNHRLHHMRSFHRPNT